MTTGQEFDFKSKLAEIESEEKLFRFNSFDNEKAIKLGTNLILNSPKPISVVVELAGIVVFQAVANGSVPNNLEAAKLKLNVAKRWGKSSHWWHFWMRSTSRNVHDFPWLDPHLYMDLGGSFPIYINDQLIGGVAISGMPPQEDHNLLIEQVKILGD
jgi:uncharacterized protein (UPF0303 family)